MANKKIAKIQAKAVKKTRAKPKSITQPQQKQPANRRLRLGMAVVAMLISTVLIVGAFLPIFSVKRSVSGAVAFPIQKVQDSSIELGDSQIKQKGVTGQKNTVYSAPRSIINIVFGGTSGKEKEVSSNVAKSPEPEIVATGTRKYQYMYCSTGHYRYYTDEQFKNPNTGYTHKSSDYCTQNNQGKMTQLADSAPGSNSISNTKPYIPSNCTTITLPYTTTYQNVSYLDVGQTQTSGGIDGYRVTCTVSSTGYKTPDYNIQPINKIVYRGTSTPTTYSTPAPTSQYSNSAALAQQKCTRDYSSAKSQLIVKGAGSSSAMEYIQILYAQCMARAGN